MISPRWRKILADLWGNKVRTVLVILSIGLGVFAVGSNAGLYSIVKTDISADYRSTNPYEVLIFTNSYFDDNLLEVIRRVEGVGEAEGRATMSAQVKAPGLAGQEVSVQVEAVPKSLDQIKILRLRLEEGSPTLREKEIYIERASIGSLGLKVGDIVRLKVGEDRYRDLRIAGIVHDSNQASYTFAQSLYAYVTADTLEWMGGTRRYNRLMLTTSAHNYDPATIKPVADRVVDKIDRSGVGVAVTILDNPGQHPAQPIIDSTIMLTSGLGVLALFLSTFLVVNTISGLLNQQIRQIGVMKAIGADMWQVMGIYLVLVLFLSVIALIFAIPLAGFLSYGVALYIANLVNVNLAPFRITPLAFILEVVIGLFVPLFASLAPIINGSRLTVREAISNYGLATLGGRSLFDRMLENVRGLPRPLLISLRNTFRRKARLVLTLFTLLLGGAIFIAVLNVKQSMYAAIDVTFGYILSDINVDFGRGYRVERIQDALGTVPGIVQMEGWGFARGQAMRPDGDTGTEVVIVAPPAASKMIEPVLTQGRWLAPGDENAIVVGNHYMKRRPETRVGDVLQMRIDGKDHPFTVVGVYKMAGNATTPIVYANFEHLTKVLNQSGQVYSIRIRLKDSSFANQKAVADMVKARFKELGMPVSGVQTGGDIIQSNRTTIDILINMLLIMAFLIGIVGGLGLMGTMSMNVLERTREIGVMRSIGAVNSSIFQLVVTEGMMIGMISWGLGAVLAIPITQVLDSLVGVSLLNVPLDYIYSYDGLIIWLVIVVVLSAVASMLPARNAVRLTVRDVLAYE